MASVSGTGLPYAADATITIIGGILVLSGGEFSRTQTTRTASGAVFTREVDTRVYNVKRSTITLELHDESDPALRTAKGTIRSGSVEYIPHYQSDKYLFRR